MKQNQCRIKFSYIEMSQITILRALSTEQWSLDGIGGACLTAKWMTPQTAKRRVQARCLPSRILRWNCLSKVMLLIYVQIFWFAIVQYNPGILTDKKYRRYIHSWKVKTTLYQYVCVSVSISFATSWKYLPQPWFFAIGNLFWETEYTRPGVFFWETARSSLRMKILVYPQDVETERLFWPN